MHIHSNKLNNVSYVEVSNEGAHMKTSEATNYAILTFSNALDITIFSKEIFWVLVIHSLDSGYERRDHLGSSNCTEARHQRYNLIKLICGAK